MAFINFEVLCEWSYLFHVGTVSLRHLPLGSEESSFDSKRRQTESGLLRKHIVPDNYVRPACKCAKSSQTRNMSPNPANKWPHDQEMPKSPPTGDSRKHFLGIESGIIIEGASFGIVSHLTQDTSVWKGCTGGGCNTIQHVLYDRKIQHTRYIRYTPRILQHRGDECGKQPPEPISLHNQAHQCPSDYDQPRSPQEAR